MTRASKDGSNLGVDRVFDVENERVELAVGDHAHAHFAPEAALVGVKLPDRLEPLAAGVLDDSIRRELAVGPAVPLGGRVDPGAIIIQSLGRQCQLASRHAGPVEVFLGDDRHEDPIFLFVHRDRPDLGNSRGQTVLGRLERLGRQQVGHGIGGGHCKREEQQDARHDQCSTPMEGIWIGLKSQRTHDLDDTAGDVEGTAGIVLGGAFATVDDPVAFIVAD